MSTLVSTDVEIIRTVLCSIVLKPLNNCAPRSTEVVVQAAQAAMSTSDLDRALHASAGALNRIHPWILSMLLEFTLQSTDQVQHSILLNDLIPVTWTLISLFFLRTLFYSRRFSKERLQRRLSFGPPVKSMKRRQGQWKHFGNILRFKRWYFPKQGATLKGSGLRPGVHSRWYPGRSSFSQ